MSQVSELGKERKIGEVIKETHIKCRMQKYMKGDRANQYLCYNSVLRKTIM
jgi:hypothetical protein